LHIPVLIKKIYVFISFLYELFPLRQEKWYQEQWKGQRIRVEFSMSDDIVIAIRKSTSCYNIKTSEIYILFL